MGLFSKISAAFSKKSGKSNTYGMVNIGSTPTRTAFSNAQKIDLNATYCNCVDFLARQASVFHIYPTYKKEDATADKANANLSKILTLRPNESQSAVEYQYTMATSFYKYGIAISRIERDERGQIKDLWPVDTGGVTLRKSSLGIWFDYWEGGVHYLTPDSDMIVLVRKPNANNPLFCEDHSIDQAIATDNTNMVGIQTAIEQSHVIQYIIKWPTVTKNKEDIRKDFRDQISQDTDGLIILSNGEELTRVENQTVYAKQPEIDEVHAAIFEYFGLREELIQSKVSDTQHHYFVMYVLRQFAQAIAQEFTYKIFTSTELSFGNAIQVDADTEDVMSVDERVKIANLVKDTGYYTPNEIRKLLRLDPIKGGDEVIQNLTYGGGINPSGKTEQDDEAESAKKKKEDENDGGEPEPTAIQEEKENGGE